MSQRWSNERWTNNDKYKIKMVILCIITDRSPWTRSVFVITMIGSCVLLLQRPIVPVYVRVCVYMGDETIDNYVLSLIFHPALCNGSLFPWNSYIHIQTFTHMKTYSPHMIIWYIRERPSNTLPSIARHMNFIENFGKSINNNEISKLFFFSVVCKNHLK